jgi:hypothetical protein
MFHLYCTNCDRASPVPPDTDAIILLCPVCNTRRDLRPGAVPRPAPAPEAVQPTPGPAPAPTPAALSLPEREPTSLVKAPDAEYPISPSSIETRMGCGWMLLVFGAGALVLAVFGMGTDGGGGWLLAAFAGLVVFVVGIGLVGWARANANLCVRTSAAGLERTWGSETIACRWEDITHVWHAETRYFVNGVYTKTTHHYRIRLKDDRELEFDDTLQNVAKLGETLLRETFERMLPRATEAFEAGQPVRFGSLELTRDGLVRRNFESREVLPWAEVNNVDVNTAAGTLTINRKTGRDLVWWEGTCAGTPNLMVLLQMLDGLVGVTRH